MQILWGNEYKICNNDHTITHPMFCYAQHQDPILCTAHVIVWLSVGRWSSTTNKITPQLYNKQAFRLMYLNGNIYEI
jgi:hypothetical protein